MMRYLFWYVLTAIPCFMIAYLYSAHSHGRLEHDDTGSGFWWSRGMLLHKGLQLFVHDYMEVYCPWSWEIAQKYRLADMHTYLGDNGRYHDILGHLTAADCHNSDKQEAIARHCYISRTRFWANGLFNFFISPMRALVIIILDIVTIGGVIRQTVHKDT